MYRITLSSTYVIVSTRSGWCNGLNLSPACTLLFTLFAVSLSIPDRVPSCQALR